MSDIKIFNKDPFNIILIEPGKISHLDWNNPEYVQMLISMPFVTTNIIKPDEFADSIFKLLNVGQEGRYHLVTENISEEPGYLYEIIYIDTLNKHTTLPHNELATMLHLEAEQIHGNAIIMKTHIPSFSDDYPINDMSSSDLYKIIRQRGFTKVVLYDSDESKLREDEFYGDMDKYANKFFEEEYYHKIEIAFLKHNINIFYTKSNYGKPDVCGKLLKGNIDKFLIFTMITPTIRGNITLSEVEKIIKLSNYLESPYKMDNKWCEDEKDIHGRNIIKNRFKILDNVYKELTESKITN
jgi:hypothetical protein